MGLSSVFFVSDRISFYFLHFILFAFFNVFIIGSKVFFVIPVGDFLPMDNQAVVSLLWQ